MNNEQAVWDCLFALIRNPFGVSGVMGNFQAESAMRADNLQDSYQAGLGMNDAQYTAAVDNGSYRNFVHDGAGYGLYQATWWSIKQHLLQYARIRGTSVGDRDMQVDAFCSLLRSEYSSVWNTLLTATSVRQASDAVLLGFERPADQSEAVQRYRAALARQFYDRFASTAPQTPAADPAATSQPASPQQQASMPPTATSPAQSAPTATPQPSTGQPAASAPTVSVRLPLLSRGSTSPAVASAQLLLIHRGFSCGGRTGGTDGKENPDGVFGPATEKAVTDFQSGQGLTADGVIGSDTWAALIAT